MITTRAERRQLLRDNLKHSSRLQLVPESQWPSIVIPKLNEVWRSRDFLVQVFVEPPPVIARLSVCTTRHDGKRFVDGITWDDLQRLKAECGFGNHLAVEIYPRDTDVVNVANMRHLWVLSPSLPFGWRNDRAP